MFRFIYAAPSIPISLHPLSLSNLPLIRALDKIQEKNLISSLSHDLLHLAIDTHNTSGLGVCASPVIYTCHVYKFPPNLTEDVNISIPEILIQPCLVRLAIIPDILHSPTFHWVGHTVRNAPPTLISWHLAHRSSCLLCNMLGDQMIFTSEKLVQADSTRHIE